MLQTGHSGHSGECMLVFVLTIVWFQKYSPTTGLAERERERERERGGGGGTKSQQL